MSIEVLSVADAKRRFSELLDRVARGERIVVTRRGKPAVALVPPADLPPDAPTKPLTGFAALAGALADIEASTRRWGRSWRCGAAHAIVQLRTSVEVYCLDTDVLSALIRPAPPAHLRRRLAALPPTEQCTTSVTSGSP